MITRIYIDNYKCFSNFEYKPGQNQLLLGRNGSGKSTVFEVIRMLKALVLRGALVSDLLDVTTLTRWQRRAKQTFEIEVKAGPARYRYALVIDHGRREDACDIDEERLESSDGADGEWCPLFARFGDSATIYSDEGGSVERLILDRRRTLISLLDPHRGPNRLFGFRSRMATIYCVQLEPRTMTARSEVEVAEPVPGLSDYASWYRHLAQESTRTITTLAEYLSDVLDGFESLDLKDDGGGRRVLVVHLKPESGPAEAYRFDEISDGQRVLIALYTVAAHIAVRSAPGGTGLTFCVDEPENYLGLIELQPWIHTLGEAMDGAAIAQVLIASHHPEFIDYYAHTDAIRFYRQDGGQARLAAFSGESAGSLLPSEVVARGWEDD